MPYSQERMMNKEYALKNDFVVPAGTVFVKGPFKREYGGGNYEANIAISNDETATLTVYLEKDALALFKGEQDG